MSHKKTADEVFQEEQNQRMLGVVPMFGVTSYHDAPPLTSKQKFILAAKSYKEPFPYIAAGFQAGLSQAFNNFEGYGQGASGYGKRYGATLADGATSNLLSNFVYPVLFKQDPRYFRRGEGSNKRRMVYALEQTFISRKDSDLSMTFSYSNVLGALTSGGISNAYYPQSDRGFGLTMSRAAIALGWGSLGNILLEFWPDVEHRVFHKPLPATHTDVPVADSTR